MNRLDISLFLGKYSNEVCFVLKKFSTSPHLHIHRPIPLDDSRVFPAFSCLSSQFWDLKPHAPLPVGPFSGLTGSHLPVFSTP